MEELVCGPAGGTHEAVVSGPSGGSVLDIRILVSVPGLPVGEVTTSETAAEAAGVGSAEPTSGLVLMEAVVSDSLWETPGAGLEILEAVSALWLTHEAVASDSTGATV